FRTVLQREATAEELDSLVGKPVRKVMSQLFPEHGESIMARAVEHYHANCESIRCYDGVKEMIKRLAADYALAIVSSKPRMYILRELEVHELLAFFPVIVGQEDTELHKPHPAPLLLAAEQLDIEPEHCMYVGDQPTDMIAAHRAGMVSAAALWGEGKRERLSAVSPRYVFEHPHSLLRSFSGKPLD
ncbi:MAG: gph, partial [Paenibacillus sp.]|nr:gph [Paenibacillus sp.]